MFWATESPTYRIRGLERYLVLALGAVEEGCCAVEEGGCAVEEDCCVEREGCGTGGGTVKI